MLSVATIRGNTLHIMPLFSATGTGQWHHAQALQYNNITVSENDFLRYSYSITVSEKLIAHTQQWLSRILQVARGTCDPVPCFFISILQY